MAMTSARPAALPATDAEPALALDRADRSALLRFMLLMRATEERALTLYRQGKVPGSYYDGRGQEATCVGHGVRARPARPRLHPAPRPGRPPRPRRDARTRARADDGPRGRRHPRPRRQHALRRPRARLRRDGLDAARHDARRLRHGARVPDAPRAARRDDLVRRRLDGQRPVARGDEHRRRAQAAGRLRAREQPVRLLDAERPRVRGRPGRARGHLRLPGREGRRQRRRGRLRGRGRGVRARPHGRRPDADRVPRRCACTATARTTTCATCRRRCSSTGRSATRSRPTPRGSRADGVDVEAIEQSVREELERETEWALAQPMPDPATAADGVFADADPELGDGQAPWSRWEEAA